MNTDANAASPGPYPIEVAFPAPYTGLEQFAAAGSVIGWSNGQPVRTPYPDCVLVMPSLRQLRPGMTVVRFGKLEREMEKRD